MLGIAPITAVGYGSKTKPSPQLLPAPSGGDKGGGVLGRLLAPVPTGDAANSSTDGEEGAAVNDVVQSNTSLGRVYLLSPS